MSLLRKIASAGLVLSMLVAGATMTSAESTVTLGDERLSEPAVRKLLEGKRIGILTHHAARSHAGEHVVDRMKRDSAFDLKMIFAPEHGYRSVDDTRLPDSHDPVTGLPVFSLYGPRKAPTPEMLAQVDTVVIDLQDVGLRYYTYPATVAYTLRSAKAAGKNVVLFDRPNPLNGARIDGAILEISLANEGLTSIAQIPTRHGLTLGELANYLNARLKIDADLQVIPVQGWNRKMRWSETGLPWVASSPALLDENQVFLYSFLGTLESVNLAVGRGKTNEDAFRIYGAPWITVEEQKSLIQKLNALAIPEIEFSAHAWTPTRALHQGKLCRGFRVNFKAASMPDLLSRHSLGVYATLKTVLGSKIDFNRAKVMLGAGWLSQGLDQRVSHFPLLRQISNEVEFFSIDRAPFLLY